MTRRAPVWNEGLSREAAVGHGAGFVCAKDRDEREYEDASMKT